MGNRQSLDNKKIINDHFNQIINKGKNPDKDQIEKIKEIKENNLKKLDNVDNERLKLIKENFSLDEQQKIDRIKEEIIKEDCVILEDPKQSKRSILCLSSWFYNQKDLEFIQKIHRFR
jgi:hypothetical protein